MLMKLYFFFIYIVFWTVSSATVTTTFTPRLYPITRYTYTLKDHVSSVTDLVSIMSDHVSIVTDYIIPISPLLSPFRG